MNIAFFGHKDFHDTDLEEKTIEYITTISKNSNVNFYLGNNGKFDDFARRCCVKYKQSHIYSNIFLVMPYHDKNLINKIENYLGDYDNFIYPDLKNTPLKFSILKRNEWLINNADVVICYINYSWGGAYQAVKKALSKNKIIYNIGELNIKK